MADLLRQTFRAKRKQVPHRNLKNSQIAQRLLPFLQDIFDQNGVIGLYAPIQSEADILPFLPENKNYAYPKVTDSAKGAMEFRQVSSLHASLEKGAFGICEPDNFCPAVVPDLLVVPMLGFQNTNRLGYGGGFYDRYLAAHPACLKIGIAFEEQEGEFPVQPWDAALDMIITPERIIKTQAQESK